MNALTILCFLNSSLDTLPENIGNLQYILSLKELDFRYCKISELPEADTIFIGGTGGDTRDIVEFSQNKLKSGGRIVIGIILIETLYSVLQTIEKLDFTEIDITQITIGKSRKTSTGTMMLARNPVTVISATKK